MSQTDVSVGYHRLFDVESLASFVVAAKRRRAIAGYALDHGDAHSALGRSPLGSADWAIVTAKQRGLESTMKSRGCPKRT